MKQIISSKKLGLCMALTILIFSIQGCTKENDSQESEPIIVTDYSKSEHWLALPENNSKPVDIFYVYPTAWTPENATNPIYCDIDNSSMLTTTAFIYKIQATAFETAGNIYAPYYRQANAAYTLALKEEQRWEVIKKIPALDVNEAFDYYIKHYNNNRPFIIAGHSQGANVMLFLLSDYMAKNPEVYARMIAAYVIGYPVTTEFMTANNHLKFAEGPDDTGVIISYNTQSPSVLPQGNFVIGSSIGLVINPINWKRDETPATASESLGSLMPASTSISSFAKVPAFADARIDLAQGVVICSSVNEDVMKSLNPVQPKGVYHSFDFPFYYFNLRENAENRANLFLAK